MQKHKNLILKTLFMLFILSSSILSNAITLTLIGNNPDFTIQSVDYNDLGATTTSTETISISKNNFDVDTLGRYEIIYRATDTDNNIVDTITRTVYVVSKNKLDIDNNGKLRASTDGVILYRYINNVRDNRLIINTISKDSTLKTETEINAYLEFINAENIFDIDSSGGTLDNNDSYIILRYLIGVRGFGLTNGLTLSGTRTSPASITNYLNDLQNPR